MQVYTIRLESQILHKAFEIFQLTYHKNSHNGYSLYLLIHPKISGIVDLILKSLPKVNTIPTSKPTHWMKPIWMLGWILDPSRDGQMHYLYESTSQIVAR